MTDDAAAIDRQGLEIIDIDRCWELVGQSTVGRVAFMDAGEPLILPVNHVLVGHKIAFLTAPGSKLGAAMMAEPVGFEVDGFDTVTKRGWSVVIKGVAEPVYDEQQLAELDATGLSPWATEVDRIHWVQILVSEISGRRIPNAGG